MTQTSPFDPTMFGGNEDVPPQQATVAWEALDANDYRTTLEALGQWLQWLVPTYRVPPSVIPPCWFLHAGLIEELGHLWTGWQVTRHPESGVGLIGLDWETHRERATARLRELVGTAGCNGTSHAVKPDPKLNRDEELWQDHLNLEAADRTSRYIRAGITAAVTDVLLSAEARDERVHRMVIGSAYDPKQPTAREIVDATEHLSRDTEVAIQTAIKRADDARRQVQQAAQHAAVEADLETARIEVTSQIVDGTDQDLLLAATAWLDAVKVAAPAEAAVRRAAAANAARATRA